MKSFFILLLIIPAALFAAETEIINNVSVSADSGNKRAEDGLVITGTSSVDVSVRTEIDGEVLEEVEIHEESSGEPVFIKKESENVRIEASINAENEKETEKIESGEPEGDSGNETPGFGAGIFEVLRRILESFSKLFFFYDF